jgi:hypothetical protein
VPEDRKVALILNTCPYIGDKDCEVGGLSEAKGVKITMSHGSVFLFVVPAVKFSEGKIACCAP